jgi:short-subunit dehydrogenase
LTKLVGARALVTGASSGIGAATVRRLAGLGAKPLLVGRDGHSLDDLATETGGDRLVADLRTPGVAAEIAGWAGAVDLLVCNAGIGWAGPLDRMADDSIDELVTVNLTTHLNLARLLLPGMVSRNHGHLVLVSSIAGCLGVADEAVYAATKAGLRTFANSIRLAHSEIGVTTVIPGVVDTPFFTRRGKAYDRTRPKPVSADQVAAALINAIQHNKPEVFVPAWLRFPARLQGAFPTLVHRMQRRFG